jgi:hypothetical protein
MIGTVFDVLAAGQARWRRARNLRAGQRSRSAAISRACRRRLRAMPSRPAQPCCWLGAAAACWPLGSALPSSACMRAGSRRPASIGGRAPPGWHALQPVLPGAAFTVPSGPETCSEQHGGAALLILSGLRPNRPAASTCAARCWTRPRPPAAAADRLPLRRGRRAGGAQHRIRQPGRAAQCRNLAEEAMPRTLVLGQRQRRRRRSCAGRAIRRAGSATRARRIGRRAAPGALGRQGWLLWATCTAHPRRAQQRLCAPANWCCSCTVPAGARPAARPRVAFPARARCEARAGAGRLPRAPPPRRRMEDQRLFDSLRARGLVRLGADGLAELAPADLPAWRSARPTWQLGRVALDAEDTERLLERLYHRADGDFVREQVRIFNSERRLLAWRLRPARRTRRAGRRGRHGCAGAAGTRPCRLGRNAPVRAPAAGLGAWQRVAAWPARRRARGCA